jgi:iron complex outermembrane receptor protein
MPSRSRNRAARCSRTASASLPRGRSSQISAAVAAALASVAAPRAPALDAAAAVAAGASGGGALQEVVVTARKREENLQDVPISLDVFTKKDLQNLNIVAFEDYAQKDPSISFVSTGPGTQVFVMRGASDGSNPNYPNTSATGFFLDDVSLSDGAQQPDLHLYDIERIEVLNGPQGTTYGSLAMTGAIRYITNKPDVNAFSAGADFDGGKIQNAQYNQTYEAFINVPVIEGTLGFRASAFSDSHGGFINNRLTTRTWVNGAVSDNSPWARNDYNREHVEGGRVALKAVFGEGWSATLTYSYQRMHAAGAWDEDPTLPPRTVARFGPESNDFQAKIADFHVDGDVGIADLVFASSYWKQPRRQWNEYSQYEENYLGGAQEGYTCLHDPVYSSPPVPYSGCNPATQAYSYILNPENWSDELRLVSKPGGRLHWLVGLYWEKYWDAYYSNTYYMPGLQYQGDAFQSTLSAYSITQPTLPPGVWYSYLERSDYKDHSEFANISFDVTDRLNVEAGVVHFHSDSFYYTPLLSFAYAPNTPSAYGSSSHKVNGKLGINYKAAEHVLLYADFAQGFRDGGTNSGLTPDCVAHVPYVYTPDTLNNFEIGWKTTSLGGRLLWNGAVYDMEWKKLQALIYDPSACPSSSFNINVGGARIYGAESNVDYKINKNWSLQASANYTDAHVISTSDPVYQPYVGERLSFAPYFNWSWNARYEHPLGKDLLGYAQFDVAHKGDMWNALNPNDKNLGLPRILQPAYTIMNLRFGLTPPGAHWLAELYIANLTDKNAIVYSNTGNFDLRLTTNQPRVYGLRVNYRFGKETNSG